MSSIAVSSIVLAVVFGGALLGMFLRTLLPKNHLSDDSKSIVMISMGLVATMTALVLGLLISSAKSSFDTLTNEILAISAKVILLDRVLANYGQDTKGARDLLRNVVANAIDRIELKNSPDPTHFAVTRDMDSLYDKIQGLLPQDDRQRTLRSEALSILREAQQTRWLIYQEQQSPSIPLPVMILLVSWLTLLFISFGLFAPTNGTVVASLLASAVSVSGAILLILALYSPRHGLIKVSGAALRATLTQLGN